MTGPSPFSLAVCAEMLWRDRPIEWRAAHLKELGFGVGLWNWPDHDLAKLEATGATFTIMNGYLTGRLTDDDGAAELLRTARETAQVGKRLGVHRLNLHGTGLGEGGLPVTPRRGGHRRHVAEGQGHALPDRRHGRGGEGRLHPSKTSTFRSITPASPSHGPRTRWRWYPASITRACVSTSTSTTRKSARGT